MRKLDLSNYPVRMMGLDEEGKSVDRVVPYNVRTSIEAIMLATGQPTSQRLSMSELLRNARLAQKILDCKDDFILLEEHEFQLMKKSFEAFSGFSKQEVEMCRRIMEAPTVEVAEKAVEKSVNKESDKA